MKTTSATFILLIALSSSVTASPFLPSLVGNVELVDSGLSSFVLSEPITLSSESVAVLPALWRGSIYFDVYHISITNTLSWDITTIGLDFPGTFVNEYPLGGTFVNSTELPTLGPNVIADSFFVIPSEYSASDVLSVNTIDSNSRLSTYYTVTGDTPLIRAGTKEVVAVLSVPANTTLDLSQFSGDIGSRDIVFVFIPEPSSSLLTCLALIGVAGVAKRCNSQRI